MPEQKQNLPSWHPHQELTAENLRQLECYLLSSHSLFDSSYGIHTFDLAGSLEWEFQADSVSLRLSNLRALTASGHPILLGPSDSISARLKVDGGSDAVIDLRVEVNAASVTGRPLSEQPGKLSLSGQLVSVKAEVVEAPSNVLFLGRYRIARGPRTKPQMLIRPVVFRLGCFQTSDPQWDEWTLPLRERIRDVLLDLYPRQQVGGVFVSALTSANWLSATWPKLSICELAFRLRLLNSLLACKPGDVPLPFSDDGFVQNIQTAADLPRRLADLVDLAALDPKEGERIELLGTRYVNLSAAPNSLHAQVLRRIPAGVWEIALLGSPLPKVMRIFHKSDIDFKLERGMQNGSETLYMIGEMPKLNPGYQIKFAADVLSVKKEDTRIYFTRK